MFEKGGCEKIEEEIRKKGKRNQNIKLISFMKVIDITLFTQKKAKKVKTTYFQRMRAEFNVNSSLSRGLN